MPYRDTYSDIISKLCDVATQLDMIAVKQQDTFAREQYHKVTAQVSAIKSNIIKKEALENVLPSTQL